MSFAHFFMSKKVGKYLMIHLVTMHDLFTTTTNGHELLDMSLTGH